MRKGISERDSARVTEQREDLARQVVGGSRRWEVAVGGGGRQGGSGPRSRGLQRSRTNGLEPEGLARTSVGAEEAAGALEAQESWPWHSGQTRGPEDPEAGLRRSGV